MLLGGSFADEKMKQHITTWNHQMALFEFWISRKCTFFGPCQMARTTPSLVKGSQCSNSFPKLPIGEYWSKHSKTTPGLLVRFQFLRVSEQRCHGKNIRNKIWAIASEPPGRWGAQIHTLGCIWHERWLQVSSSIYDFTISIWHLRVRTGKISLL